MNLKNNDGYTPLHMACIRLEPGIILSLIEKGASVLEWTPDGHDALSICKRLTREEDYNRKLEKGQKRSNAYLCVDILEQQTKRTCTWDLVAQLALRIRLCCCCCTAIHDIVFLPCSSLEFEVLISSYAVECAKFLFPSQAMLAMGVADADSTEDFTGTYISKRKELSPNENTTMQNKRLRFDALAKTVELGKRNFPNCYEVVDKMIKMILSEESTDPACFKCCTAEDKQIKRTRYCQLKEEVLKALDKDKAAAAAMTSTLSSSSTSRSKIVTPGGSPPQAVGASTDSSNAPALPFGLCSQVPDTGAGQLESQGGDVVEDNRFCVGSKTKLKSTVWNEIERVKIEGDWKGKCSWCKKLLSASSKNGTQHLHRHLKICQTRKAAKGSGPI